MKHTAGGGAVAAVVEHERRPRAEPARELRVGGGPASSGDSRRAQRPEGAARRVDRLAGEADAELLCVGAMFHDLGLLQGHRSEHERFAIDEETVPGYLRPNFCDYIRASRRERRQRLIDLIGALLVGRCGSRR